MEEEQEPIIQMQVKDNSRTPWVLVCILLIILGISILTEGFKTFYNIAPDKAKEKAENYINAYLMQNAGQRAEIINITDIGNVYKIELRVNSSTSIINAYISKDGRYLYPTVVNLENN